MYIFILLRYLLINNRSFWFVSFLILLDTWGPSSFLNYEFIVKLNHLILYLIPHWWWVFFVFFLIPRPPYGQFGLFAVGWIIGWLLSDLEGKGVNCVNLIRT